MSRNNFLESIEDRSSRGFPLNRGGRHRLSGLVVVVVAVAVAVAVVVVVVVVAVVVVVVVVAVVETPKDINFFLNLSFH